MQRFLKLLYTPFLKHTHSLVPLFPAPAAYTSPYPSPSPLFPIFGHSSHTPPLFVFASSTIFRLQQLFTQYTSHSDSMELNVEKYGYAQMGAMAINGFCAPLAHGIYTVTAFMVHKGGASHKLGDMRVTTHQELRPKPEVVAYLWAGDRVTLFEHDTTPTRLHTGELRIFIHLLINNWPRPQYGWITYSPVPNTTWLCLEQHLMLHTTAPIDPYYASTLPPPLLVAPPFTTPTAVDTSTLSAAASTAGYHPEGAEALFLTDAEALFLMDAPAFALPPPLPA